MTGELNAEIARISHELGILNGHFTEILSQPSDSRMESIYQLKENYIVEIFRIFYGEEMGSEDIDWEDTGKMFDENRAPIPSLMQVRSLSETI